MDDPLKPTSVPLEAETILWFEFLLNPSLLTTHLQKENASPTPIELISKFLSMAPESQNNTTTATTPDIESAMNRNEGLKIGRKQLALKILGLKVASYLKWNLQVLERNLSLQKQVQLLSDLCSITSDKLVNLPLSLVHECHLGPEGSKKAFNFALTLYHRWVLRAQVLKEIPPRVFRQGFNHLLLINQEQANSFRDEMFLSSLEPFTQTSIDFLNQICQDDEPFIHLIYGSFVALNPNSVSDRMEQDFENSIIISKAELRAQIAFDLCEFYLYDKKYDLAKQKAIECRDNLAELKKEYAEKKIECNNDDGGQFLFCTFTDDELNGRLMACGLFEDENVGLLYRMNGSIMNKYKDIQTIFELDNVKMEIPLVNRRILEFDMEGINANDSQKIPRDSCIQIAALNAIRSMIDFDDLFSLHDFLVKYQKQNGLSILVETAITFLKQSKQSEHHKIVKEHFYNTFLTADATYVKASDLEIIEKSNLLSRQELDNIKRSKQIHYTSSSVENISFSPICTMPDWKLSDDKVTLLELGALKRQLINCATANAVRVLLVKCTNLIMTSDPRLSMEPWHINPSWIMPISIKSVLMSMPRGFLQDFSYICIAKAKDFAAKQDFKVALNLLNAAKSEVQRHDANTSTNRLNKLIDNEILLTQATQQLQDWPKKPADHDAIIVKCKQALKSNNGENVPPRIEILPSCAAVLLNSNEANELLRIDRRFPSSELFSAIAAIVIEIEQHKATASKKVFRDAWDMIAPMFANGGHSSSGNNRRGRSTPQHNIDADGADRKETDDATNQDVNMQYDEQGASGSQDDTTNSNGNGSRNMDVDDVDGHNNEREKVNPFSNRNRNNFNNDNSGYGMRDSPAVIVNTNLLPFIQKLRDPLPITIMLSLFSRLHNILDDNSNREINGEHMILWPTSVTNPINYNIDIVLELLNITLKQALHCHPQYVPWLRIEGDLEFRNDNYEAAMSSYVNAILTGSEYFSVNLEQHVDDYIIRRMIKCCSNLGCFTQAAVLCQFLEEIDYSLAFKTLSDRATFKSISDKTIVFSDAMDSYYNCIWDATLLEFIVNYLAKRGEHARKQLAIAALGQLELNANNNDEVKREAASTRQIKFLRALAKQYLL
ncbi:integrator complex subunit 8 isoform X3 [Contarinia nasturtii]|uniref:integrator complex subunit 8 isoform X3 n=1 Tax=Contarinia nasturtii TaxID=265458 RepID=UPI0012D4AF4F|nr:integrator complex subunit 8 isoform X3 [Contarinia nasturtii]